MTETRSTLLRRVRDPADADGWCEFVALYEPLLLAYVRRQGLGDDAASDVVQEVFAKLVKALPAFNLDRDRGRFRTWLWRVACHAVADWARRRRRQGRAEEAWVERLEAPDPTDAQQEADWDRLHRHRVLEFALDRVRGRSLPKTWACFEGHVLRGRPSAEVGAELGLAANAVDVNASRVLARVREQCVDVLEELSDGPDPLPG